MMQASSTNLLQQLPISKAAIEAMMAEAIQQANKWKQARDQSRVFDFRGNNDVIQSMENPLEILLCGAAGTGKSLAWLYRLHRILTTYANTRWLIARKVRADLAQSVLVTFEEQILKPDNPILSGARRENRLSYKYPNGSEIILAGMDRPGRILSAEFDGAYLPEAVQFTQEDIEMIIMRLRHNATPFKLLMMDTNPDKPDHWLKRRCDEGNTLLLNTWHKDNPALYDIEHEEWTEAGAQYLDKLKRLSGVRRARYLENKWVIAEGAIFDEWDESIHVIDESQLPPIERYIASIDFGYTNAFVWQVWGLDHDSRMYLIKEIYMSKRLVEDHAKDIKQFSEGISIEFTVADHDAEDRATLRKHGIQTRAAYKAVNEGIQAIKERLRPAGDGKPRLFIVRGSRIRMDIDAREAGKPTSTLEEIPGYVWNDKKTREEPKKEDDHGVDTLRYAVMAIDKHSGGVKVFQKNPFYS